MRPALNSKEVIRCQAKPRGGMRRRRRWHRFHWAQAGQIRFDVPNNTDGGRTPSMLKHCRPSATSPLCRRIETQRR